MRPGSSVTFAIALCLAACSTPYKAERDAKQQIDPIATYQRSAPTAPPQPAFQDFGFVQGDQVLLTFNASLAAEQVRQQCDKKPIEKVLTQPRRYRSCLQQGLYGCMRWDTAYNEQQPPCEKTSLINANICASYEDPNRPTVSYRTVQDCYNTPAPADTRGNLQLYAVPAGTDPSAIARRGRILGSIALGPQGSAPQAVTITDTPRPTECLALVDVGNQPVRVRTTSTGSAAYLFTTPKLQSDKVAAAAQARAAAAASSVNSLRADIDRSRQAVMASPAWKDNRCTPPPMRALPAEPPGIMKEADVVANAQGYCVSLLANQVDPMLVLSAAQASQVFAYTQQFQRLGGNPANAASCTHRSHFYPNDALNVLRGAGEVNRGNLQRYIEAFRDSDGQKLADSLAIVLGTAMLTQQQKNELTVSMLNRCTYEARRACEAPATAWREEVARIRSEPKEIADRCTNDLQRFQQNSAALKVAEQEAAQSAAATQATPIGSAQRLALSEAVCAAQ